MGKVVKSLFLVAIFIGLMSGIAKAKGFWVKFIDGNGDGYIDFYVTAYNYATQDYYMGVADIAHTTIINSLLIPSGGGFNSTSVHWNGTSLTYDVFLTPDINNATAFYWTSQGDAVGNSTGATLSIDWFSGSSIPVAEYAFSFSGDTFAIVPVPLPSAFWLFASGIIILGCLVLIRKRLLIN